MVTAEMGPLPSDFTEPKEPRGEGAGGMNFSDELL